MVQFSQGRWLNEGRGRETGCSVVKVLLLLSLSAQREVGQPALLLLHSHQVQHATPASARKSPPLDGHGAAPRRPPPNLANSAHHIRMDAAFQFYTTRDHMAAHPFPTALTPRYLKQLLAGEHYPQATTHPPTPGPLDNPLPNASTHLGTRSSSRSGCAAGARFRGHRPTRTAPPPYRGRRWPHCGCGRHAGPGMGGGHA